MTALIRWLDRWLARREQDRAVDVLDPLIARVDRSLLLGGSTATR